MHKLSKVDLQIIHVLEKKYYLSKCFHPRDSVSILSLFIFVQTIPTCKTKVGSILTPYSLRLTLSGRFHLYVQHFAKCYRMYTNRSTPETQVLHITTFHHTFKHMLGPHASFRGIPPLRWSISSETLYQGTRKSTPLTGLRRRLTNGTFSLFTFFRPYLHVKQRLGPF